MAAVNAAVLRSPKLSIRKSITHRPFWATLGQRRGFQRDLQWLQLDGAFPHTALENRLWLEDKFDDQIVSLKTPNECAPHSPDLTPLDYFFGGTAKTMYMRISLLPLLTWKQTSHVTFGLSKKRCVEESWRISSVVWKCAFNRMGPTLNISQSNFVDDLWIYCYL